MRGTNDGAIERKEPVMLKNQKYIEEVYGQKEQEELKASYKQSLANKKERKQKEKDEPRTRLKQMAKLKYDPIVD